MSMNNGLIKTDLVSADTIYQPLSPGVEGIVNANIGQKEVPE